jgi:hypothetical protein
MRFMILVKAAADSEAGAPSDECLGDECLGKEIADYLGELAAAGVLVDVNRLQPSSEGWRIEWSGGRKIVTDGPFAETKELICGYTLIEVASREEAVAWAARFPNPARGHGAIEVRQLAEPDAFGDIPGIERRRALQAGR